MRTSTCDQFTFFLFLLTKQTIQKRATGVISGQTREQIRHPLTSTPFLDARNPCGIRMELFDKMK